MLFSQIELIRNYILIVFCCSIPKFFNCCETLFFNYSTSLSLTINKLLLANDFFFLFCFYTIIRGVISICFCSIRINRHNNCPRSTKNIIIISIKPCCLSTYSNTTDRSNNTQHTTEVNR